MSGAGRAEHPMVSVLIVAAEPVAVFSASSLPMKWFSNRNLVDPKGVPLSLACCNYWSFTLRSRQRLFKMSNRLINAGFQKY